MIVTKKAISRRTLLRGLGAAVALPLLDAMVPAATALGQTPARPVMRFGAVYVPNGVTVQQWFPEAEGTEFEFTRILKPLAPFRDRLVILSGLDSTPAPPADTSGFPHAKASTKFLTDVFPYRKLRAGISMDQIAARVLGQDTPLPSLELALESVEFGTVCDYGSCIYTGTISWAGPTEPLPMETNPAAAFERLFGDDTTDPVARRARLEEKGSILDSLLGEVSGLKQAVGPGDRSRIEGYLDNIRDVESRIQRAAEHDVELPAVSRPSGIPSTFEEHAKLMFDVQVLGYQGDVTRVMTFMYGRELSGRSYPEIGVPDAHHPISHHRNDPERMERCARINEFHVTLFKYYLDKLAGTSDGDGSLLDQVTILYGSGMSDGNAHSPKNLPLLLAGGGAGRLKGGRHIRYAEGTPLANLHLALLDKLGAPIEEIGDSTGPLNIDSLAGV